MITKISSLKKMRPSRNYFLLALTIFNLSCSDPQKETKFRDTSLDPNGGWRQLPIQEGINRTDSNNLKQCKWQVYKQGDSRSATHINAVDSEGYYKNNIKTGYWKKYSYNGETIDSVLYENGIAKPEANKTYTFNPN